MQWKLSDSKCRSKEYRNLCGEFAQLWLLERAFVEFAMLVLTIRCGIPVIIMGETSCGKTRLIKFMCDL